MDFQKNRPTIVTTQNQSQEQKYTQKLPKKTKNSVCKIQWSKSFSDRFYWKQNKNNPGNTKYTRN